MANPKTGGNQGTPSHRGISSDLLQSQRSSQTNVEIAEESRKNRKKHTAAKVIGTHRGPQPGDSNHGNDLLISVKDNYRLEGGDEVLRDAQKPISTRSEVNQLDLWFQKKHNNFVG